jgi:hypothetical protein
LVGKARSKQKGGTGLSGDALGSDGLASASSHAKTDLEFRRQILRRESSLGAHWNDTIRSLDLRGLGLAGMAVFLSYFSIDKSVVPDAVVINAYLTVLAFCVVVCRLHLFQSIEPDMSAWWDQTIVFAEKRYRVADFAMEGPWLFLLMAMAFSTISMVSFGACYLAWSALECCFLRIGRRSLTDSPRSQLGSEIYGLVNRYYDVRIQHETIATVCSIAILVAALLGGLQSVTWLWLVAAALTAMIILLTVAEVIRNPWFWTDLSLVEETLQEENHDGH